MNSDERLLLATSQFLTSYGISTEEGVNSLISYLKTQGVFSLEDINDQLLAD